MAGPGTQWSGPLISGTKKDADKSGPANTGLALLTQTKTITQNGANAVSATFALPPGSQIVDFKIDNTVTWNSTLAPITIGISAGGSDYASASGITGGRVAPTITQAQVAAMEDIGSDTEVVATVTPSTAATAGTTVVTVMYVQTVQLGAGAA